MSSANFAVSPDVERGSDADAEVVHVVEVGEHRRVVDLRLLLLVGEDARARFANSR